MEVLKSVLKAVIAAVFTEKFIKEVIVYLLEKLVKHTKTQIDDEILVKLKDALK